MISTEPVLTLATAGMTRSIWDAYPDLSSERARWAARCNRYAVNRAYYDGTVYSYPQWRTFLKLYVGVRQIFGPLRRCVRVDVAKVPGGWALADDVPAGVRTAVDELRNRSGWRREYRRALLSGAVAGDLALMVATDPDPIVVALRPDEAVVTERDGAPFGLVIKQNVWYRGRYVEYAQAIDPLTITVYVDGKPTESRRNVLRVVPIYLGPYCAAEDGTGDNAWAGAGELLDRINDAASQTLDVVQRNAEPLTVLSGVAELSQNSDDNTLLLDRPEAKAYTLAPNLAIAEAMQLIQLMLSEFKQVLPQLQFDQLASRSDLAYETVITLMDEFISYIRDVRSSADLAFETAEQWALTASGVAGADALRYDPDRPVIAMSPMQQAAYDRLAAPAPEPDAPTAAATDTTLTTGVQS